MFLFLRRCHQGCFLCQAQQRLVQPPRAEKGKRRRRCHAPVEKGEEGEEGRKWRRNAAVERPGIRPEKYLCRVDDSTEKYFCQCALSSYIK